MGCLPRTIQFFQNRAPNWRKNKPAIWARGCGGSLAADVGHKRAWRAPVVLRPRSSHHSNYTLDHTIDGSLGGHIIGESRALLQSPQATASTKQTDTANYRRGLSHVHSCEPWLY